MAWCNTLESTACTSTPMAASPDPIRHRKRRYHSTTDRTKPMSKPYPSRRELRLQRERAERARLREAQLKRWTDDIEQRDQPPLEPLSPLTSHDHTDA